MRGEHGRVWGRAILECGDVIPRDGGLGGWPPNGPGGEARSASPLRSLESHGYAISGGAQRVPPPRVRPRPGANVKKSRSPYSPILSPSVAARALSAVG